jgi:hypothetical protein
VTVECSNCGGVDWPTLAALAIAAIALGITLREHREFLRRLRARANLRVTLSAKDADAHGVILMGGSAGTVIGRVGVDNKGDRAAGPTTLNLLAPRRLSNFRWCGPNGEPVPGLPNPEALPESLPDAEGGEIEAEYISVEIPRVGLKSSHVRFFSFYVNLREDGGDVVVPFLARASADELPEDIDEVTDRLVVRVRAPGSVAVDHPA